MELFTITGEITWGIEIRQRELRVGPDAVRIVGSLWSTYSDGSDSVCVADRASLSSHHSVPQLQRETRGDWRNVLVLVKAWPSAGDERIVRFTNNVTAVAGQHVSAGATAPVLLHMRPSGTLTVFGPGRRSFAVRWTGGRLKVV